MEKKQIFTLHCLFLNQVPHNFYTPSTRLLMDTHLIQHSYHDSLIHKHIT